MAVQKLSTSQQIAEQEERRKQGLQPDPYNPAPVNNSQPQNQNNQTNRQGLVPPNSSASPSPAPDILRMTDERFNAMMNAPTGANLRSPSQNNQGLVQPMAGATPATQVEYGRSGQTAREQQPQTQRRPGFTDFQRIMDLNREQARESAGRIANRATGTIRDDINRSIQETLQQFEQSADVQDFDRSRIQNILQDPQSVLTDPDRLQDIQRILGGQYTGPTEVSEQQRQGLLEQLDRAAQIASSLRDPQALEQYLVDSNETFSPGRVALDRFLLSGQEPRNVLEQSAAQLDPLAGQADQTIQDRVNQILQRERDQAATEADVLRQGLERGRTDFTSDVWTRLNNARKQAEKQIRDELDRFRRNEVTGADLNRYGLTRREFDTLMTDPLFDLTPYLEGAINDVGIQQFASPEDYRYYQAINQILGRENELLTTPAEAGTGTFQRRGFERDQALRGARALELQRQALENPESGILFQRGEMQLGDVTDNSPRFQEWAQQYLERNNLDPNSEFRVTLQDSTAQKNQLRNAGYVEIGRIARNNTDGALFVRPSLKQNISSLFDPELGDYITEGDIPFPNLMQLLQGRGEAGRFTNRPNIPRGEFRRGGFRQNPRGPEGSYLRNESPGIDVVVRGPDYRPPISGPNVRENPADFSAPSRPIDVGGNREAQQAMRDRFEQNRQRSQTLDPETGRVSQPPIDNRRMEDIINDIVNPDNRPAFDTEQGNNQQLVDEGRITANPPRQDNVNYEVIADIFRRRGQEPPQSVLDNIARQQSQQATPAQQPDVVPGGSRDFDPAAGGQVFDMEGNQIRQNPPATTPQPPTNNIVIDRNTQNAIRDAIQNRANNTPRATPTAPASPPVLSPEQQRAIRDSIARTRNNRSSGRRR